MATSAVLQFKNSTPQSMKDKKLYDDDNKFTNDDLQDVLDGLIKLKMSNNQSSKPQLTRQPSISPLPHPLPYVIPQHSNTTNRYNPAYQQEPTFIASSRTYQSNHAQQIAGMNLLLEAAKKVEGVSSFKIDIADINRITRKMDDIKDNDLIYKNGIIKKKSKNGISPPKINNINELMDTSLTFADLNDDFTPLTSINDKRESSFGTIKQQLRFSDMNSIGRRSSIISNIYSPNNKLTIDEQQQENKRLCREWRKTNIKEMDK
eukprot:770900_1